MRAWKWILVFCIALSLVGLAFFAGCGGDDDDDDDDNDTDSPDMCPQGPKVERACDDTVTVNGKEWTVCDSGVNISHYCAQEYVDSLSIGGGGWRLPTTAELQGLADENSPQDVACKNFQAGINPSFQLTCLKMWSNETVSDTRANSFSYFGAGSIIEEERDTVDLLRVLAVRD